MFLFFIKWIDKSVRCFHLFIKYNMINKYIEKIPQQSL